MVYHYKTHGTCSRAIDIELDENNVIRKVAFDGGCNGNTKGVAALVQGMKADEVIGRLENIRCERHRSGASCFRAAEPGRVGVLEDAPLRMSRRRRRPRVAASLRNRLQGRVSSRCRCGAASRL